ncbi:uncharacterized protein zgc:66455 isoform X2 [Brienomyrus brachyistius]|uniref:uncharacterized protein zgc:66455 isoform X2 n=1 Tax=Brienomyrus brachyistius TaxID=42636 RepID=UPI0020B1F4B6|nr:uncharacterized protein zgc:66455 isoform X2 [Brienomyrus brachyistius]
MKFKTRHEHFVFFHVYTLLVIYGILPIKCAELANEDAAYKFAGHTFGKEGNAFFALRSCHHELHGDSGEFFSPDYMCSSPPLWCNWTIQVKPGMQVHLQLEDLTPADACHHKNDQIHLDESPSSGRHRVLHRCWGKTVYKSQSSTLHVVLLIGGNPRPPLRGFRARYHALWPEHIKEPKHNEREGLEWDEKTKPSLMKGGDDLMVTEPSVNAFSSKGALGFGLPGSRTSNPPATVAQPETEDEIVEHPLGSAWSSEGMWSHLKSTTDGLAASVTSPKGISVEERRPNRNRIEDLSYKRAASDIVTANHGVLPSENGTASRGHPFQSTPPEVWRSTTQLATSLERSANSSRLPHLPGDSLFEVAVEVYTSPRKARSLDHVLLSLQKSVENIVQGELSFDLQLKAISSERTKRLHAGMLFIMWVQFTGGFESTRVYESLSHALRRLLRTEVRPGAKRRFNGTIASITTEDVDECRTQLLSCDVHADCINLFGSYACRCQPGFEDMSPLDFRGTICLDPTASSRTAPTEVLGALYAMCFLLSLFLLILLCVAVAIYRRHHRGVFLMPCGRYGGDDAKHMPPPPPPIRRPRDGWESAKDGCPSGGLPLIRFSSLLPPGVGCGELDEVAEL